MANFEEIEQILNYATAQLLTNDNIYKLVSFYPETINFKYDPLSQKVPINKDNLLLNKIYPMPKTPDPETEQICFVAVRVSGGDRMRDNTGFTKVLLIFDIICHLDVWMIKGGYRPLRIVREIDKMFNNNSLEGLAVNKLQPLPLSNTSYSYKFYGYQLAYEVQLNSNIVCGGENERAR